MPGRVLLLVDDEAMIREAVSSYFEKKGFLVHAVETGKEALELFHSQSIDFVILDLMLPDLSGEEICRTIRKTSNVPIVMLTAKTQEKNVLDGLRMGADDYVRKPFSLKELYARAEAILRRSSSRNNPTAVRNAEWRNGDLAVDFELHTVKKAGKSVSLTPIEWKIFSTLALHPQKVYTRDELLSAAFDMEFDGYDRVIDTHIKNLRKKIEDDSKSYVYILTVWGTGYRFGGEDI